MAGTGSDRHITVFSPEGKLYQVEYAFKAVKTAGITSVGIRGKDDVAVVIQKQIPDKLTDPSTVTHLFKASRDIGLCVTGMHADTIAQVHRVRKEASDFKYDSGIEMPVHALANRMADLAQTYTQHASMRPYGVVLTFLAIDQEDGPRLYQTDPAGFFAGFKATTAGEKAHEAQTYLEKKMRSVEEKSTELTFDRIVRLAISTLQNVFGADMKASGIEVGCVRRSMPEKGFFTLTEAEIERQLVAIAEEE